MSCLIKIRELYEGMSKTEKKIANFFINNSNEAMGRTIGSLAVLADVSEASIVRFCQAIGYSGYREFMLELSAANRIIMADIPYADIKPGDSTADVLLNVFNSSKQAIDQTLSVIEESEVVKAVNLLKGANRIDFFGVGAGNIIALDAQQKFIRINKISYAFSDNHIQSTVATTLSKNDVLVAISYSGETVETYKIAQIAKQNSASVISITKYGENSLSKIADIRLFVSSPESEIRSAATGSRIAQLCLIDILYTSVLSLNFNELKGYLNKSREALCEYKLKK